MMLLIPGVLTTRELCTAFFLFGAAVLPAFFPSSARGQDGRHSLAFDGVDDYVEFGDVLNDIALPFSFSVWVNVQGTDTYFFLRTEDTETTTGLHAGIMAMIKDGNEISIHYGDGTGGGLQHRRGKRAVVGDLQNRWHHIAAVVRDARDMSLYVDGIDVGGSYEGSGGPIAHSDLPVRVGRTTLYGPWYYNGLMDEMRIYDVALEADEVRADMHREVPSGREGLVAYWRFNEGNGHVVLDATAHNIDGLLGGSLNAVDGVPAWHAGAAPVGAAACLTDAVDVVGAWSVSPNRSSGGLSIKDLSYLAETDRSIVLGHNGEPAAYVVDNAPTDIAGRWSRSWCLDFSETPPTHDGIVALTFDHSAAAFDGYVGDESLYRLLYRSAPSGPYAVVTDAAGSPLTATQQGDQVTFLFAPSSRKANGEAVGAGEYTVGVLEVPLPVELAAFSGLIDHDTAVLSWQTASETNNAGFDVERSLDGLRFEAVGFVEGQGTSATAQRYRFSDPLAPLGADLLYYRLKQIDFDGAFAYSEVIELRPGAPEAMALTNYPNPFNAGTVIRYSLPVGAEIELKVYDVLGREVALLEAGYREAGRHQVPFAAERLPSGTYVVRLAAGSASRTQIIALAK